MVPKKHNVFLSVFLFCVGGFIFREAATFPEQVEIFPVFIGSSIMILSFVLFLIQKPWVGLRASDAVPFKVLTLPALSVFLLSVASILLMEYLGFYICATFIIVSFALLFKGLKPHVVILSIVILNALVYSLFYKYLNVPIPLGIFAA